MSLLSAHEITKAFGPKDILSGVSVTIEQGDRLGLVGKNGAGKSTLIRILAGQMEADGGELLKKRGLRVNIVEQAPHFAEGATVGETIMDGLAFHRDVRSRLERVSQALEKAEGELDDLIAEQAELSAALERAGGWNVDHQANAMLDALRAPPRERKIDTLSIGERRRVALAVGLLSAPDILVLDEPTNHLDLDTIEWLERTLVELPGALILVTHDRYFLDRVANRLAEIDRGKLHLYEGNYTEYMVKKAERLAVEARTEHNRQRAIEQELQWVRKSAPARTTKQKARLDRFDQLVAARPRALGKDAAFRLPHPARIGKTILELDDVSVAAGDKQLVERLTLRLKKGDRIGIVGPNGAGKTTLIRTILGEVRPAAGAIVAGKNTAMVYADQGRTDLDLTKSVLENVAGKNDKVFVGDQAVSVHAFLGQLLFDDGQQRALVGSLSGGEKSRVALAKSLRQTGNLLILDEPTNDLDLATLRVLEDALVDYPGCVLVVSHDRYFLDRVATAILAFEGDGRVTLYEGNHASYRARLKKKGRPAEPAKEKKGKPTSARARTRRTFKEQQEFNQIEEKIMEAETRIEAIEAELSDPEAIKRLGAEVQTKVDEMARNKEEIEKLFARWEALSGLDDYGS